MRHATSLKRRAMLAIGLIAVLAPSVACGADAERAEAIGQARVYLARACPLSVDKSAGGQENFAGGLAGAVVGVVGDVVKGGLDALAAALEEAAKEKAIGGRGVTRLRFYTLSSENGGALLKDETGKPLGGPAKGLRATGAAVLAPNLDKKQAGCLILWYGEAKPLNKQSAPPTFKEAFDKDLADAHKDASGIKLFDDSFDRLERAHVRTTTAPAPKIYVEAALFSSKEGFWVKPQLVWYHEAFGGLPEKQAFPTELQAIFSTPGADTASPNGTTFAIARIPLFEMKPGNVYDPSDFVGYASGALPLRPVTGFVQTQQTNAETAMSAARAEENHLIELVHQLKVASDQPAKKVPDKKPAAQKAGAKKDDPKKDDPKVDASTDNPVETLEKQIKESVWKIGRLQAAADSLLKTEDLSASPPPPPPSGAAQAPQGAIWEEQHDTPSVKLMGVTNATMQFVLIRSPNEFYKVLATALKAHSTAIGQAVTTGLTPAAPTPAWTPANDSLVRARDAVEVKQAALDAALLGTDQAAIAQARRDLREAQSAVNTAAVAAGQAIPYPELR